MVSQRLSALGKRHISVFLIHQCENLLKNDLRTALSELIHPPDHWSDHSALVEVSDSPKITQLHKLKEKIILPLTEKIVHRNPRIRRDTQNCQQKPLQVVVLFIERDAAFLHFMQERIRDLKRLFLIGSFR